MSSKRKPSLLNRVLGKGKDNDEEGGGGGKKKGKKGSKLEKVPSVRQSFQSDRPPTIRSVTHASEAPMHQYEEDHGEQMHYEQHYGAPVTAVHDDGDEPYSPFGDGDSAGRPSMINVHPAASARGGGDFFGNGFQASPRNTYIRASVYGHPPEHAEEGHGGGGEYRMAHEQEPVHATPTSSGAGVSRQPTILGPGGSTEPSRMLKPGDQMEIDPRNPPTFVIDEGVTLEIGDEVNGFIPYEQYLAELAARPPPKTGGTYIVQGGGDVVIQDETGKVIRTIPGTGAMAGRGEPKIYESTATTTIATFTTTLPTTLAHKVRVVIRHSVKEQREQVEQVNQVNQNDQTSSPKKSVKILPSKFSKFPKPSKPSKSPKSSAKLLEASLSSLPSPPSIPSPPFASSTPSTSPEPPKLFNSPGPSVPSDIMNATVTSTPAEPTKRPQSIKRSRGSQRTITTKSAKPAKVAKVAKPQPRPLTVFFTRPFQKRVVHDPLNPLEAIKEPLPNDAFPYASLFAGVEEVGPSQLIQPVQPIPMIPMTPVVPIAEPAASKKEETTQPLSLRIEERVPWLNTSEVSVQTSPQASGPIRLSIAPTRGVPLPPIVSPIPRSPISPIDALNSAMDNFDLDVAAGRLQFKEEELDNVDSDLSLHNMVDTQDAEMEENNWPPRSSILVGSPRKETESPQPQELHESPQMLPSEPIPIPSRSNSGMVPRKHSSSSFSMDAAIIGSFDNRSLDNISTIEGYQEQDQYQEQEEDISSASAFVFDQMPIADPAYGRASPTPSVGSIGGGSFKARGSNPYTRLRDPSVLPVVYGQNKPRSDSVSSLPLPPPMATLRQTKRVPTPMPTPPPHQSAKMFVQPMLNASPKIRALIERLETGKPEEYGETTPNPSATSSFGVDVTPGSVSVSQMVRSMTATPSLSRNGSISSLSRRGAGSPWLPPSRPASRPSTPGFGSPSVLSQGFVTEEPQAMSPMELGQATSSSNVLDTSNTPPRRTGTATGMGSRDSSPQRKVLERTYMVEAVPGLNVQRELMRELSQQRLRRTNYS